MISNMRVRQVNTNTLVTQGRWLVYTKETRTGVAMIRAWVVADDLWERMGNTIMNMTRWWGMMGWFLHLLQYTSKSLALWLQMPGNNKPNSGFGSLALLGRGLMGWLAYLSAVRLSLGFGVGIGIGLVHFHDADGPASLMMVGHSVGGW